MASRPILDFIDRDPVLSEDLKLAISAGYELHLMTTDRDFWKQHYNQAAAQLKELQGKVESYDWRKWIWFGIGVIVTAGCIGLSMWGLGQIGR